MVDQIGRISSSNERVSLRDAKELNDSGADGWVFHQAAID